MLQGGAVGVMYSVYHRELCVAGGVAGCVQMCVAVCRAGCVAGCVAE